MVHRPKAPRMAAQTRPVQPRTVQAIKARSRADPPIRIAVCTALRTSWLRRMARSRRGGGIAIALAREVQQLARQAGERLLGFRLLRDRTADVARGKPDAGGQDTIDR